MFCRRLNLILPFRIPARCPSKEEREEEVVETESE
jgi:hypothetical protein